MDKILIRQSDNIITFFNNEVKARRLDYNFKFEEGQIKYGNGHIVNNFKVCVNPIEPVKGGNELGNELWIYNPGGPGEDNGHPLNLKDIEFIETKNWPENDIRRDCVIKLKDGLYFSRPEMKVFKGKQ